MFKKILIANRGEIALRVVRAAREMGVETVAVHSTADADAMHVRMADEAICIGPPPSSDSYLSMAAILSAAEITGAEAIHPGYGFLVGERQFRAGGRGSRHQVHRPLGGAYPHDGRQDHRQGNDAEPGRALRARLGGRCRAPGNGEAIAADIGYPVIIKATAGGGGRGMKLARSRPMSWKPPSAPRGPRPRPPSAMTRSISRNTSARPRHIEVQVFGDGKGGAVHLGERDCSLQRRHQKVLEEAPAPPSTPRRAPGSARPAPRPIGDLGYEGAGTIEFLYEDGEFYFIEMNTRLQVEHPVTEAIFGVDLVREQIQVAAGMPMSFGQDDLNVNGHAIEVRINAEKLPEFRPEPRPITQYHAPGGLGIRMDSALYDGYRIPPYYDSLIAKLIVHGRDRPEALARLNRALGELIVDGIDTTVPLFHALLQEPDIQTGRLHDPLAGRLAFAQPGLTFGAPKKKYS
jgi:acetyl-CoA carboxylase biotin carboxylase subunit